MMTIITVRTMPAMTVLRKLESMPATVLSPTPVLRMKFSDSLGIDYHLIAEIQKPPMPFCAQAHELTC
jgi:hypothetical protein